MIKSFSCFIYCFAFTLLQPDIPLPDSSTMDTIKGHLHSMQKAYSPLKKMECLLAATSTIYKCVSGLKKSRKYQG